MDVQVMEAGDLGARIDADMQTIEAQAATLLPEDAAATKMQAAQAEQAAQSDAQEYKAVLAPLLSVAATIIVPAWEIKPEEIIAVADAWGVVLAKYFPGGASNMGPEITALVTLGMVILPRLGTPRNYQPQPQPQPEAKASE